MSDKNRITIAIDVMGGDDAPEMVIAGTALAARRYPQVSFALYGDESKIHPLMARCGLAQDHVRLYHADQVITGDMKPSVALRNARRSSMRLAIEAVAQGNADGVVSAGNTGAYMAIAKILLKSLPGIHRPAIAAIMPTITGQSVMMDLGAGVEASALNLVQFSLMGQAFAECLLNAHSPAVGLLNVGAETLKGHKMVQEAHQILESQNTLKNYHGFVEGDDILSGAVDVIVTDGFTGNIALKTAEGTYKCMKVFFSEYFQKSLFKRLLYLFARPSFKAFRHQFDPRRYNGATFLGLNGIAVKSHGGTDAEGFSAAIGVTVEMVSRKINQTIKEHIEKLEKTMADDSNSAEVTAPSGASSEAV